MGFNKLINQFLAGVLVMIYHIGIGQFIDRNSIAFAISLYIFVLTMMYLVALPVDEDTGHIQDQQMDFGPFK